MEESEFFRCKHCGKEHEASTQEIGSYICPKLRKQQGKVKVLDSVSLKNLTKINNSSKTEEPQHNRNGESHGEEK